MKIEDYFDEYWLTVVELIHKEFPTAQQASLWTTVWCSFAAGFAAGINYKESENEGNNP